jgi:hypothetical protein
VPNRRKTLTFGLYKANISALINWPLDDKIMSGVLCVWANLPGDVHAWYEDTWIPKMRTRIATHALQCELTESGFGGDPIEKLDAPWPLCAVYEVEEVEKATQACYDKENHPSDTLLAGPLADARFDVRTYRELKRWQEDAWDGGKKDVFRSITYLTGPFKQTLPISPVLWL